MTSSPLAPLESGREKVTFKNVGLEDATTTVVDARKIGVVDARKIGVVVAIRFGIVVVATGLVDVAIGKIIGVPTITFLVDVAVPDALVAT